MISSGNGSLQTLQSLIFHHTRIGSKWTSGVVVALCCHVLLFATPWRREPGELQSTGFFSHEYWSRLPFPSLGDLCHLVSCSSCISRRILYHWANWETLAKHESLVRMDFWCQGQTFDMESCPVLIFLPETEMNSSGSVCLASQNSAWVSPYWCFLAHIRQLSCVWTAPPGAHIWMGQSIQRPRNTETFLFQSECPMTGTENW